MTEWEKVVRGLECCIVRDPDAKRNCVECPYNHEGIITNAPCANGLMTDVLALLKEQEEGVTPIESTTEQKKFADRIGFAISEFWCGACHFNLVSCPKFCPNCGKKVKWDD